MQDEKRWKYDLETYLRQGEPEKAEKSTAWQTAIGLQAVDGLTTSDYLLETAKEHIEGHIDMPAAKQRIQSYYEAQASRQSAEADTMEADLVFDVRFLPNPYYVADLRPLTGLDERVRDYVFSSPQTGEFMDRLEEFVGWLLPRYEEEGKTALVIAVGCTGGHHRSVAVAHALAERLRKNGGPVAESHRDMGRS